MSKLLQPMNTNEKDWILMNIATYLEFLYLNHSKIITYIEELDTKGEDCLYYVEEAMQDSQVPFEIRYRWS